MSIVSIALVQLAVKIVGNPPEQIMRSIDWGLDVAWDLYVAAGTIGFSIAFRRSSWFRAWSVPGVLIAAAFVVLNVASFPKPPDSAGLIDLGPLVGLWYATVAVRAIVLLRVARRDS